MDLDRWRRIEEALDRLFALEETVDLAATVRELCPDDPEIHQQVLELAQAARRPTGPFAAPLSKEAPDLLGELQSFLDRPDPAGDGDRFIGSYRLLDLLGRGGMGVVYLAERADQQFEKQVAIKLMPHGLETPEMERRFRIERQILADLEHPDIARLLDGGVTDEGYPYLVMELVDGRPIDLYCREEGLGLKERLRLFRAVCSAVQFAHQRLVVHRDLKPNNILVTGEGQPKLLDFGVAKLVVAEGGEPAGGSTVFQPRTPGYASPEQLANRPVSTATDVYSLGVVLYHLLTGRAPHRLEGLSPGETEAAVSGQPVALPSLAAAEAAHDPGTLDVLPRSWGRRLRGDLDNILLKALARDPARRYPIAEQLGDDLGRYLEGLPVRARRPTRAYRARKFVSRHRFSVAAAALVLLSIAGALIGVTSQAERARVEAQRATRVAGLLSGLFADADPYEGTAREITVPELLDRGEARIRQELAAEPDIRSDLLQILGQAHNGQGLYERAIGLHREALEERRRLFGDHDLRVAESMLGLGSALQGRGAYDEAEPLYHEALAIARREAGPESAEVSDLLLQLGLLNSSRGDYDRALELFHECLRIRRQLATGPDYDVAIALNYVSGTLDHLGQDERGLELLREALDLTERTVGEEHPTAGAMRHNLALRSHTAGDFDTAEESYRRALEIHERKLGAEHPETANTLMMLGRVLVDRGDFAGAGEFVERAAAINRELEPSNFNRIAAELNLATVYREVGRLAEAEELYRSGVSRLEELVGVDHGVAARVRSLLAFTLHARGEPTAAEPILRRALEIQRDPATIPNHLAETLVGLGSLLCDLGRATEALPFLEEALEIRERVQPAGNWQIAEARLELGAALLAEGRVAEAEGLLRSGYDGLSGSSPANSRRLRRGERFLARLDATRTAG